MAAPQVDYDQIAPTYDQRYGVNQFPGIAAALRAIVQQPKVGRVLEVGCGTGRWLAELQPLAGRVYGVDLSLGMLQKAQGQSGARCLTRGDARELPFVEAVFDVVFCVNALHHFPEPRRFVREARRVLGHGGVLAVIGMDPHGGRDRWYIYDYFPGTSETDRERFPSRETLFEWLRAAGFGGMEWRVVEHIVRPRLGREVLEDPILQKDGTSQLALLTHEAYAAGRRRIEADLGTAEARGETMVFPVDLRLVMISGHAAG